MALVRRLFRCMGNENDCEATITAKLDFIAYSKMLGYPYIRALIRLTNMKYSTVLSQHLSNTCATLTPHYYKQCVLIKFTRFLWCLLLTLLSANTAGNVFLQHVSSVCFVVLSLSKSTDLFPRQQSRSRETVRSAQVLLMILTKVLSGQTGCCCVLLLTPALTVLFHVKTGLFPVRPWLCSVSPTAHSQVSL